MTTMTLHEALQHEPNLQNCQGIPQYIIILSELLEYNTFDTINIKRELPNWIRKNIRQATATQKANQSQSLFMNSNPLRHKVTNTQVQQHQQKKRKSKTKTKNSKKKFKEKKDDSMYLSKNQKRKLKKISEQEEYQLMCEERDSKYFDDDKPEPEFSTPRRINRNKFLKKSNSSVEKEKVRNFNITKSQSTVTNKYKKTISFNMDDMPEAKPKMIREESKSSRSRDGKKAKLKNKPKPCEFIPIRESQLNNSVLFSTPMRNKDDFLMPDNSKSLDVDEPSLKKKVQSYNINVMNNSSFDFDDDELHHGLSDPLLSNKYKTSITNVIPERVSENVQSSKVSESVSDGQEFNPMMNTLFVPKLSSNTEAKRKRVISFKKNKSGQPPDIDGKSPSINEIDEYLQNSDDDMDDESIKKFIKKNNESQKLRKESIDDLLDDSDEHDVDLDSLDDPHEETKEGPLLKMKKNRKSDGIDYNEDLINSALRIKQKGNSTSSDKKPPPFTCNVTSIADDNLSDDINLDGSVDPYEEYEGKYKKGGGGFKASKNSKTKKKNKPSKTGKKARNFAKKTKNKYDPGASKRAARETSKKDE